MHFLFLQLPLHFYGDLLSNSFSLPSGADKERRSARRRMTPFDMCRCGQNTRCLRATKFDARTTAGSKVLTMYCKPKLLAVGCAVVSLLRNTTGNAQRDYSRTKYVVHGSQLAGNVSSRHAIAVFNGVVQTPSLSPLGASTISRFLCSQSLWLLRARLLTLHMFDLKTLRVRSAICGVVCKLHEQHGRAKVTAGEGSSTRNHNESLASLRQVHSHRLKCLGPYQYRALVRVEINTAHIFMWFVEPERGTEAHTSGRGQALTFRDGLNETLCIVETYVFLGLIIDSSEDLLSVVTCAVRILFTRRSCETRSGGSEVEAVEMF